MVVPPTSSASQVPEEKTPEKTASITGGGADSPSKGFESLTSPLFESFIMGMSEEAVVNKRKSGTASGSALVVPVTGTTPIVCGLSASSSFLLRVPQSPRHLCEILKHVPTPVTDEVPAKPFELVI